MCNTACRMYITCKNVTTMGSELFIMIFVVVTGADHQSVMPHPVSDWVSNVTIN